MVDDPSVLPVSRELARELKARLEHRREDPDSAESWDSVEREIFGTEGGT
jgi:hypothetical protein